jgi:hypothetical protein
MSLIANRKRLEDALTIAGAYLADRGVRIEVVAIGGCALLLRGIIDRPTQDLDLIATVEHGKLTKLESLPAILRETRDLVARQFDLAPDWLNVEPSSVMDHGLPSGFLGRCVERSFEGLVIQVAGNFDLICLKLHAATDRGDPLGKHALDLRALSPTRDELIEAAKWAQQHDPSAGFRSVLLQVLRDFGVNDADEHLEIGL